MEDLIKQLMSQMDKRFEQMDKGFDQIDTRFDKVENDIEELKKVVSDNQTENRSHFKHIESKLEEQKSTFQVVA